MTGTIFDVKEMAVHDGPGIRTTVFFKGCPMRCRWCHNPEGLSPLPQVAYKSARCTRCGSCLHACSHPECREVGRCIFSCPQNCLQLIGRRVEAHALAEELKRGAAVLGDTFGGFTFSGGEPLMQPKFLLALAEELNGYHLCVETSGYADEGVFESVLSVLDLVIFDIKIVGEKAHKFYTGCTNSRILRNFEHLRSSGKPYVVRTPLIPGITDTEDNLNAISRLVGDGCVWERLPYNAAAGAKYDMLGLKYEL